MAKQMKLIKKFLKAKETQEIATAIPIPNI